MRIGLVLMVVALGCERRRTSFGPDPATVGSTSATTSPAAAHALDELRREHPTWLMLIDANLRALGAATRESELDAFFDDPLHVKRSDAGFGVTHISSESFARPMSCTADVLVYEKRVATWTVHCGPHGRWDDARDQFLLAIPALFAAGDDVEASATVPTVMAAATKRRASALGAVVPVKPAPFDAQYRSLISARSMIVGFSCGLSAHETEEHVAVRTLEEAGRFDLLRNVLRGPNAEARILAARSLLAHLPLDPSDAATISALEAMPQKVETCSGCTKVDLTAAVALKMPR